MNGERPINFAESTDMVAEHNSGGVCKNDLASIFYTLLYFKYRS